MCAAFAQVVGHSSLCTYMVSSMTAMPMSIPDTAPSFMAVRLKRICPSAMKCAAKTISANIAATWNAKPRSIYALIGSVCAIQA